MTRHFIDNDVSLGIFDNMTDYLQPLSLHSIEISNLLVSAKFSQIS